MQQLPWSLPMVAAFALALSSSAAAAALPTQPDHIPAQWVWPLDPPPTVLRGFDPPPAPWLAGHRGVDLAAHPGQQVRAAASGVVSFAGLVAGRSVVSISHGALRTTYEPVDALLPVDTRVDAGTVIGVVSTVGGHCNACLHWGVRDERRGYRDPLAFLSAGPVRLLPVWDDPAIPTATSTASTARAPVYAAPAHGDVSVLSAAAAVMSALVGSRPGARTSAPRR